MSSRNFWRASVAVPIVVVLFGWWFFSWRPSSDADVTAAERRDAADRRALVLQAELRSASDFRSGGRRSDDELEAARDAVPGEADLAGFLRLHDELAGRGGVIV